MANLLSIAEQVWLQLFPKPTDETKTTKEEVIATAKSEYAFQLWQKLMAEKREEGYFEAPSYLLTEVELEVKDNVIDLTGLKIMRGLPSEIWLQKVGDIDCKCKYIKTTFNLAQVLCNDDSLADTDKPYYAVGKKIKFPRGTHASKLPVTYANSGETVDGRIEVDDIIGGVVRRSLLEIYGGKIGREDKTNNTSSDT